MAAPLVATPTNLSLSPTHHHHSKSPSLTCLTFKPNLHRIRRNLTHVAFNGNPQAYKHEHNHSGPPHKSLVSVRVLGPNSSFLQMDPQETSSSRTVSVKSSASDDSNISTSTISQKVFGVLHLVVSLGIVLAMDKFLKKAFVAAAIKFPSALFGMFCIFSVLVMLDTAIPAAATSLMNFFEPALMFIQRWLPLFYVPALVVLPLSVRDIPASSGIISSLFSLYSTALVGRLVGLEPSLTVSILPRCITVALALTIVSFFEGANSSLTAAAVVVTGLIGANFVQAMLDKLRFRDPIARGIATASSAHGLGTAALSAKEPEALPFCAIAYGLTGIFGSLFCSVPAIRQSLLAVIG
ncbi:Inner membrane protein yohK isoform 2 [Theobroma cacao]|uniref:Inner membrane protein yohK isoform 2 n=1 Tax=Theobroma cacao TaxID=3641 RepID=A0A061G616_THECC|nr:Inner membrane protein yohK isoform 2 [Theobroma cacao]